jgi:hypothetical protein
VSEMGYRMPEPLDDQVTRHVIAYVSGLVLDLHRQVEKYSETLALVDRDAAAQLMLVDSLILATASEAVTQWIDEAVS